MADLIRRNIEESRPITGNLPVPLAYNKCSVYCSDEKIGVGRTEM